MNLFAEPLAQLVTAVLLALVSLNVLDDVIADLFSRVPVVGPVLARVARWFSGKSRAWLQERIPQIADRIVRQVEGSHEGAHGAVKLQAATAALLASPAAAGLRESEATAAAQAAVDRAKAEPHLAMDAHGADAELLALLERLEEDAKRYREQPIDPARLAMARGTTEDPQPTER